MKYTRMSYSPYGRPQEQAHERSPHTTPGLTRKDIIPAMLGMIVVQAVVCVLAWACGL